MKSFIFFNRLAIGLMVLLFCAVVVANLAMAATGTFPGSTGERVVENSADDEGHEGEEENWPPENRRLDEPYSPSLIGNLMTLAMLVLLQAVLGFDNLLYISLESKNAPLEKQSMVRAWGIGLAIFLRVALLGILVLTKDVFEKTELISMDHAWLGIHLNLHALITIAGGAFIIYTAMKEIWHMIKLDESGHAHERKQKSVGMVIFWIVVMNIVFSFDSILSAMALSDVFWVMCSAIVISGIMMIYLADRVSNFLAKNKMYEVLGLFVLFIVGIMLVSEGGHLSHLSFFGYEVTPMSKATFYFVLGILVLVDVVQGRYQKKLSAQDAKA